ncbi:MAG: acetyl-CoA carboxylase carboxyl transferase subunit alpha [Bdellovibrionaceae bacterium]|nr:acetyl-CoA carboxylase carboxyl transferase subunit alpha [Pseudobdellovibrionaceae bacterium]|tara:strand:+ start:1822 stop:2859 length:1038 start_codon:yes stop_codon:yes gene_type:complete
MEITYEFEKPIAQLESKLNELKALNEDESMDLQDEIKILENKLQKLIEDIYSKLNSWQKVQLSRHPNRPYTKDYIEALFPDFKELQGDRTYSDDPAIIGGFATWTLPNEKKETVLILGHQKGRTTKSKMKRNFGMAKPEGYRKAIRLMQTANRMKIPVITFIDTPGAYPGIEAEERGQAQAIAESIRIMFTLDVPTLSIVIGEGGSGGALALGIGNQVLMQEYSTYSVISPESCASILWSDSKLSEQASEKLKMNPEHLMNLKLIDAVIKEPKGGAHRDWQETFSLMKNSIHQHLDPYFEMSWSCKKRNSNGQVKIDLKEDRIQKFRNMGLEAVIQSPINQRSES